MPTYPRTVHYPEHLFLQLQAYSRETGIPVSEIVRRAVLRFFETLDAPPKETP